MKTLLITGGAGFIGSNLAIKFKEHYQDIRVIAFDNLKRRGSELSLQRLKSAGVEFVHGDIRVKSDLEALGKIDTIIDCAAEPSVLAGQNDSPEYVINTNLLGTVNTLEILRKHQASLIFLSTSRVYPIKAINDLNYDEAETRFEMQGKDVAGASNQGISEDFTLNGVRSIYGTTKLASEMLIQEYQAAYDLTAVINRCGIVSGPWQMGKVDQGVLVYWAANHLFNKKLTYIGYNGSGKQVRDMLHIDDLFELLNEQYENQAKYNGEVYNVGGGLKNSLSLLELTALCQEHSGNQVEIEKVEQTPDTDIIVYISDNKKVTEASNWAPSLSACDIVNDVLTWISNHRKILEPIFK